MWGLDLLAGARYQKEVLRFLPPNFALGIFGDPKLFGADPFKLVEKVANSGKCPLIRIQLVWKDNHQFGKNELKLAVKEARRYEKLRGYSQIELSPYCEHSLSDLSFLDIVQEAAPSCRIVNTPHRGAISRQYKNETHHGKKPQGPYNFSYDGECCVDSDVTKDKKTYSDSEVFFFWHPRFNLKWSMKDTTPRRQRRAYPTGDLIKSVVYLATEKGNTSIPKNWLIKSHAEKHDAQDQKGDKLLIISPKKANEILLKRNGKVIDKLRYYGTFQGGGYRFYSRNFGYKSGTDLEVWLDRKKYGVINGGFRDGKYR